MIQINEKDKCCGCRACKQACPTNCIEIIIDEEGFQYPKVKESQCIHCDKCNKVCPIIKADSDILSMVSQDTRPKVYGGWNINEEEREKSSSGGIFTLLANYVLENNGVVYGAALDDKLVVGHIAVETYEGLELLRGSKYVQSDIKDTYKQAEKYLKEGRFVLYTGAPCQIAGLQTYLRKNYENLYTCDFICHGVPSPLVLKEYLKYLGRKYKDEVEHIRFRTKYKNWNQSGLQMGTLIRFKSGKIRKFMPAFKDNFMNGFLSDMYLRPSCYNCRFKEKHKIYVDITIADFWGVKKDYPELDSKKGTSLVLLNTEKGKNLFSGIQAKMHCKECEFDKSLRRNSSLWKSVAMVKEREQFYETWRLKGFDYALQKYMTAAKWVMQKVMIKLGRR